MSAVAVAYLLWIVVWLTVLMLWLGWPLRRR
jgi:hypothetical protein